METIPDPTKHLVWWDPKMKTKSDPTKPSALEVMQTQNMVNLIRRDLSYLVGSNLEHGTPDAELLKTVVEDYMNRLNARLGQHSVPYKVVCASATSTYLVRGKRDRHYAGVHFENKTTQKKMFRGSWRKAKRKIYPWLESTRKNVIADMVLQPQTTVSSIKFNMKLADQWSPPHRSPTTSFTDEVPNDITPTD